MGKKLVIVESPAKAKTIGSYLGSDYEVMASVGHIRDLVPNAKGVPAEDAKKWWAEYGVDVDHDFRPFYEVPSEKAEQVRRLKAALKGKEALVLATDEDREGEAISWHLLEVLKPAKSVKVERITFNEITRDAIQRAIKEPRQVDMDLVEAQETRRILDRLYGYTLSPVLWSKVMRNLSAGRVQSPAVKLVVEREKQRRSFRSAVYWDLKALFEAKAGRFEALLNRVDGRDVASGADFDGTTGELKSKANVLVVDANLAQTLLADAKAVEDWKITSVLTKEQQRHPQAPFITTTLQQEANRKFGYPADRTMRIAQTLYEGVSIGGEQVGLITYMRTDSVTLSNEALDKIHRFLSSAYPEDKLKAPKQYTGKVRNAQEAHEAIRPTDPSRRPQDVAKFLTEDQLRVYTLVWQRAVASQMRSAVLLQTEALVEGKSARTLEFRATGSQIAYPGYLRVYQEGKDEEAGADEDDRLLPKMDKGQSVDLRGVNEQEHRTNPPARYTDATLIRELERLGIGRPSTYASILSVIEDRGYVRKERKNIVPTFLAFLTMEVLENNFGELVDLGFTARLDDKLDDIAQGEMDRTNYLKEFFLGSDGTSGLYPVVESRRREIPFPNVVLGPHPETGEPVIVRLGRDGSPFLQIGPAENKRFANVPSDLAPGDLTIEKALELFEQKATSAESVGIHPETGRRLLLKFRQGFYLEVERTPEELEAKEKPTWISLPPGVDPKALTQEDLDLLCQFPRTVGKHPESGQPIEFKIGRYGAYVECGSERRTVEDWRDGARLTPESAALLLAQPKTMARRGAAREPLKEFGPLEGSAGPVKVMKGMYGPYVTDGETNATLPKSMEIESLTAEQAQELLAAKRAAGPSKRPTRGRKTAAKPSSKAGAKAPTKRPKGK